MTTWWWVRHGPTHEKAFVGWRDVAADLSDTAAIDRLRAALPAGAVIVSSDLLRAVATADAIAGNCQRLAHAKALREFNFGDWDGLKFDEVTRRDPDLSRRFWEQPGDVAPPNGESWTDVANRVSPFVGKMNHRYRGRDIIAVAHIGVIMTQISLASGSPPVQVIGQTIDTLSLTRLHWQGGKWRVGVINHKP